MTGTAVINSPHAFHSIRQLFVENYLSPEVGKSPSYVMKNAWQTVAICKAAAEICHGDKMSAKDIHSKIWAKYVAWAKLICETDDAELKIEPKPEYLSLDFFMTSDAKCKKRYTGGVETGKKFWKKWGTVKSAIINFDNNTVKRTISGMPGGALPSGTDFNLFLTRLVYNLYNEKVNDKKTENEEIKTDNDEKNDCDGDVDNTDEIGGSAAKKSGPNEYTIDNDDDSEEGGSETDSNIKKSVSKDGSDSSYRTETDLSKEDNDEDEDSNQEEELKAPSTFFPSNLLIIVTMGVLSDDCDILLNHAIDRGEVEEKNKVAVPSRAEVRAIAIDDESLSPKRPQKGQSPSAISRLKERADYNQAYKKANEEKHELGVKRLKLNEDEISLKRLEVQARQDEVKARQDEVRAINLEKYYADLRLDLKDAREQLDDEQVKSIKIEMRKVQKERRELSMNTNPEST